MGSQRRRDIQWRAQKVKHLGHWTVSLFSIPSCVCWLFQNSCHIDTAWLWPYRVTQQKVAWSWSTQVDLMERYPEHRFTCSSAQQYKWLEQVFSPFFLLHSIVNPPYRSYTHPSLPGWKKKFCKANFTPSMGWKPTWWIISFFLF